MFMAALSSYRFHTLIRPFPKHFKGGSEDTDEADAFDRLRACAARLPPIQQVLAPEAEQQLGVDELQLLAFILQNRQFRAISHPSTVYQQIQQITGKGASRHSRLQVDYR